MRYWGYIGVILGYMGIMEKKMETTILSRFRAKPQRQPCLLKLFCCIPRYIAPIIFSHEVCHIHHKRTHPQYKNPEERSEAANDANDFEQKPHRYPLFPAEGRNPTWVVVKFMVPLFGSLL